MALRAPILALLLLRQDLQGERAGPRQGNSRRMGHRPQGLPAMVGLYIHLYPYVLESPSEFYRWLHES